MVVKSDFLCWVPSFTGVPDDHFYFYVVLIFELDLSLIISSTGQCNGLTTLVFPECGHL